MEFVHHRIKDTLVTVWCGFLKGLEYKIGFSSEIKPQILWILVTSSDSSKVISGKILGSRFASIVFPEPGEPY